jgi:hypothetical protein
MMGRRAILRVIGWGVGVAEGRQAARRLLRSSKIDKARIEKRGMTGFL